MSEKDVYIGGTSIQIGEHGFINQPKEIIEYIKYLQNQLQQKENIIKEVREYIEQEYLSKLDDFERPLRMTDKDDWNKILEKLEGVKI